MFQKFVAMQRCKLQSHCDFHIHPYIRSSIPESGVSVLGCRVPPFPTSLPASIVLHCGSPHREPRQLIRMFAVLVRRQRQQQRRRPPGSSQNYVCQRCGKGYVFHKSLKRHQRYECGQEPRFACPYCGLRSKQQAHVREHIRRKHSPWPPAPAF